MWKYGVQLLYSITYASFKAKTGLQPKHGLLERIDDIKIAINEETGQETKINKISFEVTKEFHKIIKSGILFVCDEFQEIKNSSAQSKAVSAVIKDINKCRCSSRYIFLSRTPMESEKHGINIMKVIHLIDKPRLFYRNKKGTIILDGIKNLILECERLSSRKTKKIIAEHKPYTANSIRDLALTLFVEIYVPSISSAMVDSSAKEFPNDIVNGFYKIKGRENVEMMDEGVQLLEDETKDFFVKGENGSKKIKPYLSRALRLIELAKVDIFARLGLDHLKKNKTGKLVVALNYTDPINNLADIFNENGYDVAVLDGKTSLTNRKKVISEFQEDTNNLRIIIMQLKVGGAGISLHDIYGNRPRFLLVSPNYEMNLIYQVTMRIYRQGLKSETHTRIVYAKGYETELRILNALARKSNFLGDLLEDKDAKFDIFPNSYPEYVEKWNDYIDDYYR